MPEDLTRTVTHLQQQLTLVEASREAYKLLSDKYEEAQKQNNAYKCYHCKRIFIGEFEAMHHFGPRDGSPTACLVEANRKLLADNARLLALIPH